jgi:hypothetical protein
MAAVKRPVDSDDAAAAVPAHKRRAHHPYQLRDQSAPNDDVATPDDLFSVLDDMFHFTFDPCPLHGGDPASGVPDGLATRWGTSNFVNPPYSNIAPWLRKALDERDRYGASSVFLIPAQMHTSYWTSYVWPQASELIFIENRLRFKNYRRTFPSPMVCVVYRARADDTASTIANRLSIRLGYRLRHFALERDRR